MDSVETKKLVGKRIIVVAREKLEDISASFVRHNYSSISGYSGYSGIQGVCGRSGTSGGSQSAKDNKYELKLKNVELISFDDYKIQEVVDEFIRVLKLSGNYHSEKYGTWYTIENFFDAFTILKVLDLEGE